LSVVIAVVSGKDAVRRCIEALRPQLEPDRAEVIVPYDAWSADVGDLAAAFPEVRFHYIDAGITAPADNRPPLQHRLYDRRRAAGLALARGRLVAMTEDHAVPAPDWCQQVLAAHGQPYAVIGGAIDNAVDRPLNCALYYCDFGRYGRPLASREAAYVSDVNVSYKRAALEAVGEVWRDAYHETAVHCALRRRGEVLWLDPRLVVFQHRPPITLRQACRERIEWGRVFAETRGAACAPWRRVLLAAGTPLLPALLLLRVARHMLRQHRTLVQMAAALPLVVALVMAWALGELAGYVAGPPSPTPGLVAAGAAHPDR
jgi:hypothetical protein